MTHIVQQRSLLSGNTDKILSHVTRRVPTVANNIENIDYDYYTYNQIVEVLISAQLGL